MSILLLMLFLLPKLSYVTVCSCKQYYLIIIQENNKIHVVCLLKYISRILTYEVAFSSCFLYVCIVQLKSNRAIKVNLEWPGFHQPTLKCQSAVECTNKETFFNRLYFYR